MRSGPAFVVYWGNADCCIVRPVCGAWALPLPTTCDGPPVGRQGQSPCPAAPMRASLNRPTTGGSMFGDNLDRIVKRHREELRGRRDILHETGAAVSQPLGREGGSQGLAAGAVSGLFRRRDAHAVHESGVLHRRDAHPDRAGAARADRPRPRLHVRRPRRRGGRSGPLAVRRDSRAHLRSRLGGVHGVLRRSFPSIQRVLLTDVQALYDGDPAAGSEGGGHLSRIRACTPSTCTVSRTCSTSRTCPSSRAS